jgi:iron complex transport system ATP-binding protein
MTTVIRLDDVSLVRDSKPILDRIHWTVEDNQRWVIIGPNGAGKTSLLRIAAAQIHPSLGTAQILGETLGEVNVFELRTRIGFASSALAAHIPNSETVLDAVMTASYAVTGRWNESYDDIDERRARRVLAEWHLQDFADRAFGTLSDGERKRTQIARAVMTDPELLLLDEPVASLDLAAREQTIKIIGAYASAPSAPAIVMVTHHLEEIPAGFTHALILQNGKIFAAGEIEHTITSDKISEAFGLPITVDVVDGRYRARAH